MEPNLTVVALKNAFILFLRHVTAVITVETRLPVTENYKIKDSCYFEELHWKLCLKLH